MRSFVAQRGDPATGTRFAAAGLSPRAGEIKKMRAPRFQLGLRVQFRAVDQAAWSEGTTENISHSGALMRVDTPVGVDTEVEVRLLLPPVRADQRAEIACRGRVVRTVPATIEQPHPGFAITIERYEFLPSAIANAIGMGGQHHLS
jgi:hypothetical protein